MPDSPETPATRLRAAANRLRELAAAAHNGPWYAEAETVKFDENRHIAETFGLADKWPNARWIATTHPGLATHLAAWLDSAADDAEQIGPDPHAVRLANFILTSKEPDRG